MKPLTNEQKTWLDTAFGMHNATLEDVIGWCRCSIVVYGESTWRSWHSVNFFQGILHYLTWPKVR